MRNSKQKPIYRARSQWLKSASKKPVASRPQSIKGTEVTILGCGASVGCPVFLCKCPTCSSKDKKNSRSRASITIQVKDKLFLIDTSPDLKSQALRENFYWIDAVLFTHPHADHVHGIDELRSFNFVMRRTIDCYGNAWTIKTIHKKFDYIFKYSQEGGGKPLINLHMMDRAKTIGGIKIQPLEVVHGKVKILGYRVNDVAYITDCSYIPPQTYRYLKNLEVLILDCLRPHQHPTHINVEESLAIVAKVKAKRTYLTHMAHELEYETFKKSLPRNVYPAYDGLKIKVK